MSRAIVGVSGGPDSAVVLGLAVDLVDDPIPVYLDLNPFNRERALPAARASAGHFGLELRVLEAAPWIWSAWRVNSAGYFGLPLLTMNVVTALVQYAYCMESRLVIAGFREGVGADFAWLSTLQRLVLTTGPGGDPDNPVQLMLPLYGRGKDYRWTQAEAARLGLDLSATWSCNRAPCPGCFKCRERREVGIDAGSPDPR